MTATAEMTAAQFLILPPPRGARRRELVDGELVMNEPTWSHGRSQMVISTALDVWASAACDRGRPGPPIDIQLDETNVYSPDVVWYRAGRAPARHDRPPYPVPDIAVEVRSPSTWHFDVGAKKASYEGHGLPELWLVDTAADIVLVFRRSSLDAPRFDVSLELNADDTLTSPLLPGFSLPVREVFAA